MSDDSGTAVDRTGNTLGFNTRFLSKGFKFFKLFFIRGCILPVTGK